MPQKERATKGKRLCPVFDGANRQPMKSVTEQKTLDFHVQGCSDELEIVPAEVDNGPAWFRLCNHAGYLWAGSP